MKTTDENENPLMAISTSENNIKAPEHHIRQRAFEIYLDRNEDEGNEASDWLQAERELNPPNDYNDSDGEEDNETPNWFQAEHELSPSEENE